MLALIVFLAALAALVVLVGVRQHRHPVAPGKYPSAGELVNRHGRWWG